MDILLQGLRQRLGRVGEELFDFTKVFVLRSGKRAGGFAARGDVLFERRTERGGEFGVEPK